MFSFGQAHSESSFSVKMSTLDVFDPWTYTPVGKTMALIVASHSPAERTWLLNGENGRQEVQTPPSRVSIQLQ